MPSLEDTERPLSRGSQCRSVLDRADWLQNEGVRVEGVGV